MEESVCIGSLVEEELEYFLMQHKKMLENKLFFGYFKVFQIFKVYDFFCVHFKGKVCFEGLSTLIVSLKLLKQSKWGLTISRERTLFN